MKKEYIKPSMKAHKVNPSKVICGSGGETGKLSTSSNQEDVPTSSEKWGYNGIWGE